MDIKQINSAIISSNFSHEQLASIVEAVKYARSRLAHTVKYSLRVGDTVNFTQTRTGRNVTGFVTKIAIKYVTVKTADGLWKVPAAMLTKVEEMA